MIDDFTTQALAYLLDELDPESRAAFDRVLAGDAVAAAAFKACADSVALYALAEARGGGVEADERGAILAAVMDAAAADSRRPPAKGWHYFWPMAAAALLALNVAQWVFRPGRGAAGANRRPGASAAGPAVQKMAALLFASDGKPAGPAVVSPKDAGREVSRELARLAALRQEYARLQGSKDALSAEYRQVLQQLALEAGIDQGASRVLAMELVDGNSYAKGGRSGLMDLGGTILKNPGVVAAGPPINTNPQNANPHAAAQSAVVTPGATAPGSNSIASSGGTLATADTLLGTSSTGTGLTGASVDGVGTPTTVVVGTASTTVNAPTDTSSAAPSAAPPAPASSSSSTPVAAVAPPYAVSLFDQVQNQGYLDLYNLPQVSSDQSLQLWVQAAGSDTFQNVGEIPSQFYGQSGGIYYKLPTGTAAPAQIMITVEPKAAPPAEPTGTVVLRGP